MFLGWSYGGSSASQSAVQAPHPFRFMAPPLPTHTHTLLLNSGMTGTLASRQAFTGLPRGATGFASTAVPTFPTPQGTMWMELSICWISSSSNLFAESATSIFRCQCCSIVNWDVRLLWGLVLLPFQVNDIEQDMDTSYSTIQNTVSETGVRQAPYPPALSTASDFQSYDHVLSSILQIWASQIS